MAQVALAGGAGVHRAAWNLRELPPPAPGEAAAAGRGGRGGGGRGGGGFGGRGGGRGGDPVPLGRYSAQLVRLSGETATPVGQPQSFYVKELPR
ncbi:MAG: hypothetical protein R2752_18225 [Vicinamibacterales bacterium]